MLEKWKFLEFVELLFFLTFFYESFIRCLYCGLFIFVLDLLIYN